MASGRNRIAQTIAALALVGLVTSCHGERYELKQDKSGRMLRLNRDTGEVMVVAGDSLERLKTPEDIGRQASRAAALGQPKNWPVVELSQIGVPKAELSTVWRDGSLRYRLTLGAVPKGYNRVLQPFILMFYDESGFQALKQSISLSDVSQEVDGDRKPTSLSIESSIPCTADMYSGLQTWTVAWRF